MGDKLRDPKTGRFVKSGTKFSVPVRDSDDEVIENLRERLGASARRVHDLEKIIKSQDNLIDQLQRDAVGATTDTVDTAYIGDWTVGVEEEPEVPDPERGYRLIAWVLVFCACILFWYGIYGIAVFFFGGK